MIQKFLTDLIKKKMKDWFVETTGLSPDLIEQVDTDAIGSILSWLNKNAKGGDISDIFDTIIKNHPGEVIRNPDEYTNAMAAKKPEGILGHVFGDQVEKVVWAIAEKNGINKDQALSAMKFIAPLVMGYFGKQKPKDPEQLGNRLEIEQKQIEKDTNISFSSLFDQDGDGDFDLSDVMKIIS